MAQFIITKKRDEAFSVDHVYNLFVNAENQTIKLTNGQSRGAIIGQYSSVDECKAALNIIMLALAGGGNAYAPTDEQVQNAIAARDQKHQNGYHGQKPVRHGGS